ncbi:PREDICTED: uncharacterized protein LOC109229991 [Nicotiana attenuata]|uniref:uncharacterized protein LOC109229991 n=1 Tax=Nicotiana attenuata TaxID=49451 RepID=UPI0009050697|nr:PREDICTED: uncharacterized protein LOC109229991 [Nicotiana attenuata]
MVSNQGMEIKLDKIKAIEDITVVDNVKAVQRLTKCIAALGRFISRSSKKSHRFFSLLKKKNNFSRTPKCQQALEELKWYLLSPPLLHTPKADEQLYLYLAVSEVAISGVLVREEEGMQFPIYYVSRTLGEAETRYPHMEKLALTLLSASRKFKPHFQCHPMCVVTSYPLRNIMHKPELSGQLAKWSIEISGYDIEYRTRTVIKSQILAYFVADFTPALIPEVEKELLLASGTSSGISSLFMDGVSNAKGSGLGIMLKPPTSNIVRLSITTVSNWLKAAKVVEAKCDSPLVVNQVNGTFEVKEEWMQRYLEKLQFRNSHTAHEIGGRRRPCRNKLDKFNLDWRNKYLDYLNTGKLHSDPKESRALHTKASRFILSERTLFKRTFDGPLAISLGPGDTEYALREVHEGTCENHSGAESLVRKLIGADYY